MIILKGLMDVHPFDGSGRGLFVLAQGPVGEFRFPVTEEQAAILIQQFGDPDELAEPGPPLEQPTHGDDLDSPLIVEGNHGMAAQVPEFSQYSFANEYGGDNEYDDGDL